MKIIFKKLFIVFGAIIGLKRRAVSVARMSRTAYGQPFFNSQSILFLRKTFALLANGQRLHKVVKWNENFVSPPFYFS